MEWKRSWPELLTSDSGRRLPYCPPMRPAQPSGRRPLARQSDCDIARTALALEHLHTKAALRHQLITPIPIQSASRPHPASQSENCESVLHEWLLAWTRRRRRRPSSAPSAWNSALTSPPSIRPASLPLSLIHISEPTRPY